MAATSKSPWKLTPELKEAMIYASELHADQWRGKGSDVATPYASHITMVAALVIEDGGDAEDTMAAWLHDAKEDQGGDATLAEIRRRFGDRVARIVDACSDTGEKPKPPWTERKEKHLRELPHLPEDIRESVMRVTLADKLHNLRTMMVDYEEKGAAIWADFRAGKGGMLWYMGQVIKIARGTGVQSFLLSELEREFVRFRGLIRANEDAGLDDAR